MTVRELINWLEDFNEDAEVVIGMHQRYGTDFAMAIGEVSTEKINMFYGDDEDDDSRYVVITEGNQIGSVSYKGRW